jgi:DNA replication protein DnaC
MFSDSRWAEDGQAGHFQPAVERSRIETLATSGWIRERESLLIQGPSGVGKSHLAVALGVRAVENGFWVAFLRLEDLLVLNIKGRSYRLRELERDAGAGA